MPLRARASALTRFWALLEMGLAAIPLIGPGQGLFAGQINPAMGTTHHGRGALPVVPGTPRGAGEAPPEPEGGDDNGYPEQQAEQAHNALFLSERQVVGKQFIGKQFIGKPGSLAKDVAPAQRLFCLLVGNNHRSGTRIGPEIVVMGIASLNATAWVSLRSTLQHGYRFAQRHPTGAVPSCGTVAFL